MGCGEEIIEFNYIACIILLKLAHEGAEKVASSKCKILHMGLGNSHYQYKLGDERIEHSAAKNDFWVLVDGKQDMSQQCAITVQKAKYILGCIKVKCSQQVEGGDPAPLLCAGEASPRLVRPDVESSAQERHRLVGVHTEKGHKNDPRDGTPLL